MTPLLVYQNYHLIHHLYPMVVFYKMHNVWHLKYDQLSEGNIRYQSAFKMAPENIASHLSYHQSQGRRVGWSGRSQRVLQLNDSRIQ